jgi:hypothetical protein
MRTCLQKGAYPLPISVAVAPGENEQREWYEFSPYYSGTHHKKNHGWVDSKLFGSTFKDGTVVSVVPEYPLAEYLGIFGSAFALTQEDIAKASWFGGLALAGIGKITSGLGYAYRYLLSLDQKPTICAGRYIEGGQVPNIAYRYKPADILEQTQICLVDGGTVFHALSDGGRHNFATIPALIRKADIVILCDAIEKPNDDATSEHLKASDIEAKRLKLSFPDLTVDTPHKDVLATMPKDVSSLFIEKGAPIVVYMKGKRNAVYDAWLAQHGQNQTVKKAGFDPDARSAGFTTTSNFNYTPEQYDLLTGLTESIFIQSKETIKKAIRAALQEEHKKIKKK